MRIGIYASYLGRKVKTGIEVYAEEVIGRMLGMGGHEYFLVGAPDGLEGFSGSCVERIPLASRGKLTPLLGEIAAICDRFSFDVFFFPTQYTFFRRRQKNVCTAYDVAWKHFPEYFPASKRIAFDLLTSQMVKKAASILSISDATRNDLVELYSCDPCKVKTVHLGYDQSIYAPGWSDIDDGPTLETLGLERGGYNLFLGTLQKRKNVINLLRAYDVADTKLPLVLAGGRGWFYDEIKRAMDGMNRKRLVVEIGYVRESDKASLYRGCSAFLYPSLYEGFGLPVLEAMGCGCKVVTSNVSSLPEVAGDAGICVDPECPEAIAAAIDACETPDTSLLREKAVSRARLFTWDGTARQTLAAIEACGNA